MISCLFNAGPTGLSVIFFWTLCQIAFLNSTIYYLTRIQFPCFLKSHYNIRVLKNTIKRSVQKILQTRYQALELRKIQLDIEVSLPALFRFRLWLQIGKNSEPVPETESESPIFGTCTGRLKKITADGI